MRYQVIKLSNGEDIVCDVVGTQHHQLKITSPLRMETITRDTSKGDIIKAALKSICFQTKDLIESLKLDLGKEIDTNMIMRVDGGMSNNNWMMQFLADILDIKVERPVNHETTVMGAAYLAGLKEDFFENLRSIEDLWKSDRIFEPNMNKDDRDQMYSEWKKTVNNLIGL